jgi:fatty-acyl-CoA synthase
MALDRGRPCAATPANQLEVMHRAAASQDGSEDSPRKAWVRALEMTAPIARNPAITLPIVVDNLSHTHGDQVAILSRTESLTYRSLAERANQYSRWALAEGLAFGEVVGLLMANCPEYLAIWLGVTRVGGVVAFINANLTGDSLAHAINTVSPTHLIVGATCVDALTSVVSKISPDFQKWIYGESDQPFRRIDEALANSPTPAIEEANRRTPTIYDPALYIYTSGTTGLPKAARVSHFRIMQWSYWFAGMMNTGVGDRMYNCLPLCHSVGGVVAIGAMLVRGGSIALRDRFSASWFWRDIVDFECTIFQYIGELCRYLVNTPPNEAETRHRLRLACGNGLDAAVWRRFQERFRIPNLLEFYAATEGTFSLYNCEGRVGALGRIPSFLKQKTSVVLVRYDAATGEPVRGEDGFCIRCIADEVGEAIGRITPDRTGGFEGYADRAATEKKILRNVFAAGDTWFRSGDLMRKDKEGFFYFVDRVGDTFRWKGENVSTAEVTTVICNAPGVLQAAVYGVTIPCNEGRAGMAAIVVDSSFSLAAFREYIVKHLPQYARPLFARIVDEIEMTNTYKSSKNALSCQGYDPDLVTEPVYFNDPVQQAFVELSSRTFDDIASGKIRL